MFGVSFPELLVIFIVCLLVFGPDKLPEVARKLGKLSAELKKTSDAVRREFYNSVYTPIQGEIDTSKRELTTLKDDVLPTLKSELHPLCPDTLSLLQTEKKLDQQDPPSDDSSTAGLIKNGDVTHDKS